MPITSPASFAPVMRSSRVSRCASSTVKNGVVAFRMPARLAPISCWPQKISVKGRTLFSTPMTATSRQNRPSRGSFTPKAGSSANRMAAAMLTRSQTTTSGGTWVTAILANRKDPPHSTDRIISSSHSVGPISGAGTVARIAVLFLGRCRRRH